MKIHVKEFSRQLMNDEGLRKGFQVNLLDGDNNWPEIMKAVKEINYNGGWIIAEVSGGNRNRLKDISERMDKIIRYV